MFSLVGFKRSPRPHTLNTKPTMWGMFFRGLIGLRVATWPVSMVP